MDEIKITYETLFDLLRREKNREDLQELSPSFFGDVVDYLIEKSSVLSNTETDIFSSTERKKTEKQLDNVRRILIELYSRRERKILGLAVEKSITQSRLIDTSHLLNDERALYEDLVTVISKHRKDILYQVLEQKNPKSQTGSLSVAQQAAQSTPPSQPVTPEQKKPDEVKSVESGRVELGPAKPEQVEPTPVEIGPMESKPAGPQMATPEIASEIPTDTASALNQPEPMETVQDEIEEALSPTQSDEQPVNDSVKVKFLEQVPKFLGSELEEYGPFQAKDEAELPEELAQVLVLNKQAEKV